VNNQGKGNPTFDFKERGNVAMVTEFQDNYRNRYKQCDPAKLDLQLLKDLRSIHFDIKDDEHFRGASEYKSNYLKKNALAMGANPVSDAKLRKGNIHLGETELDYRTIYRDKYKHPPNNY
jgi:hypothetical protein